MRASKFLTEDDDYRIQHRPADKTFEGIQIYRAVPPGIKEIRPGDWVTTVKAYAQEHGAWIGPKFKIISKVVKAGDLYTEGNSILEWGWDP